MSKWRWLRARFSFQGRASRREYWLTLPAVFLGFGLGLLLTAASFIGVSLACAYAHANATVYLAAICLPLFLAVFILYAWALIAVSIRRAHDLDQPMSYGFSNIAELHIYRTRGTIGTNRYGPDPLQQNERLP